MGMFSWLTADTEKSIRQGSTAFLLQPDGEPPLQTSYYEGFGMFGKKDAFVWLAERNLPAEKLEGLDEVAVRIHGIYLDSGKYLEDAQGNRYAYKPQAATLNLAGAFDQPITAFDNYGAEIEIAGVKASVNDLRDKGLLTEKRADLLKYPLKFSKVRDAVYEELPASKPCPDQGFL